MALTILAQIAAEPGKEALVRAELEKLVPITRAEAGCIQYDLHVDNENPAFFVFYEIFFVSFFLIISLFGIDFLRRGLPLVA